MSYVSLAELRTLPNLADPAKFTDAELTTATLWFEAVFEDATGVAWEHRTATETLNGNGSFVLKLGHMFPRTISSVSVTTAGVATAFTAAELADLVLYDTGEVVRRTFAIWAVGNRNISVTYTHGITTAPPVDVTEAAKVAVREHLLEQNVGNRQFSVATEVGLVRSSLPGPKSPFGIPVVDEVVARRSHKVFGIG